MECGRHVNCNKSIVFVLKCVLILSNLKQKNSSTFVSCEEGERILAHRNERLNAIDISL